jgi:hypothetical protein
MKSEVERIYTKPTLFIYIGSISNKNINNSVRPKLKVVKTMKGNDCLIFFSSDQFRNEKPKLKNRKSPSIAPCRITSRIISDKSSFKFF